MEDLKRNIDLTIKLTPEEVARAFINAPSDEQAQILNHMAEIAGSWEMPVEFQLQSITSDGNLTQKARQLMALFGVYAPEKEKLSSDSP